MRPNPSQPRSTRRLRAAVPAALAALFAVAAVNVRAAHAGPGDTERVSVASDGTEANNISGRRGAPAVSADGRFVAFDSFASNLVTGDTNGRDDIFVHDRTTGSIERVSVSSSGSQGSNYSTSPAISADGRFVAFVSLATNLVTGDTNGVRDIFVHDRATGVTERVSVSSRGAQGNGASGGSGATEDVATINPVISADGRFVAFDSVATNLVRRDTNSSRDVFVRDRLTGTTERANLSSGGAQSQDFRFNNVKAISSDGRFVVFSSFATNLVPGDTNDRTDVFVRDRQAGTTERISVASSGAQADGGESTDADISGDGRFVVFASEATNLVPGDTNGSEDVFVRDRQARTTVRVSVSSSGTEGNFNSPSNGIRGGGSFGPAISGDGQLAVFDSDADILVPDDTNARADVFVHDLATGTTDRVSVDSSGTQANGASTDPDISADGTTVVFFSAASNLVPGDTKGCTFGFNSFPNCPDIFAHTS